MVTAIFIIAALIFGLGYLRYGKFLARFFELNDKNLPPSNTMYDGVDYVPAPALVLFGIIFPLSPEPDRL